MQKSLNRGRSLNKLVEVPGVEFGLSDFVASRFLRGKTRLQSRNPLNSPFRLWQGDALKRTE